MDGRNALKCIERIYLKKWVDMRKLCGFSVVFETGRWFYLWFHLKWLISVCAEKLTHAPLPRAAIAAYFLPTHCHGRQIKLTNLGRC